MTDPRTPHPSSWSASAGTWGRGHACSTLTESRRGSPGSRLPWTSPSLMRAGTCFSSRTGTARRRPTWVEEMLRHFADPGTGVVLGRIELESRKGFLPSFQSFEQPLLNQYNFGSLGVGLPTGGFGNNMAVRAVAVRQTGGFRALGFSVTEDAMLLDAVCRGAGWKGAVCTALRRGDADGPQADLEGLCQPAHAVERRGHLFGGHRDACQLPVRGAVLPDRQPSGDAARDSWTGACRSCPSRRS